ncbi:MAG: PilC/PilY family type IV pilus protein [Smithellaceae bacterium]
MKAKIICFISFILIFSCMISKDVYSAPVCSDDAGFLSVAPNALIVLDLSGSMNDNPAGGGDIWGNANCTNTTYCSSQSGTNCGTDCSRIAIAKRAIYGVLNANKDATINTDDSSLLQIRFGYDRFIKCLPYPYIFNGTDYCTTGNCNESNSTLPDATRYNYDSGCNIIRDKIVVNNTVAKYADIWTHINNVKSPSEDNGNSIVPVGGTHVVASLIEAKKYLDAMKATDSEKCRPTYIILITDGADTLYCSGNGTEVQNDQYKRRRAAVAIARELEAAGHRLFVIGLGENLPVYLKYTLNWMAYNGGTEEPGANTEPTTIYDANKAITLANSCADASTTGTCDGSSTNCFATVDDPGNLLLEGYAFIAADSDQLTNALNAAIGIIQNRSYSFTQASVRSIRTADENYVYEASFMPLTSGNDASPFWPGHLKRYGFTNGVLNDHSDWDAGTVLKNTTGSTRKIYTYNGTTQVEFKTDHGNADAQSSIKMADVGATTIDYRDKYVDFIRNGEVAGPYQGSKLGDIYHCPPIGIGTPNIFFYDKYDPGTTYNSVPNTSAYDIFRITHQRKTSPASGEYQRIMLGGANDGQLHAFKTSDGSEMWSVIPPNHLLKLKNIYHATVPNSALSHQFFNDGTLTAYEVYLQDAALNTAKSSSNWKTLLVLGEGRGAKEFLWSKVSSCKGSSSSDFSPTYSSVYKYYCGYYAFDATDTQNPPALKWILGGTPGVTTDVLSDNDAKHLGLPTSKMYMGRVRMAGVEKWVGFIGGGYSGLKSGTAGKGFYVINLQTGKVLWSFTKTNNSSLMDSDLAGPPAMVDRDNDGFVDTVYIGDTSGNIWRFKFCLNSDGNTCTDANWSGGMLAQTSASSGIRPVYTKPTVTFDDAGNWWVYWGTGDINEPNCASNQEQLFACKDNDRSTTWDCSQDFELLGTNETYAGGKNGWRKVVSGYVMLNDPTVFEGKVLFPLFMPVQSGSNECESGGNAYLDVLDYKTGGQLAFLQGGAGQSTGVSVSGNPDTGRFDVFFGNSQIDPNNPDKPLIDPMDVGLSNYNMSNTLYWHDMRVK